MKQLMSLARCAMEKFGMVSAGDRIAVGVSGGKDSVALLCALAELQRFYPEPFSVTALTLDPCFGGEEADYSALGELCRRLRVPLVIRRSELGTVIFENRKEKNPCSLCARMRRGILHDMAKAAGCNKIALGHHADDAAETFLMNLLSGGTLGCFSPVTYLSRKDITLIRPLIFAREKEIARAVRRCRLPVVKSACPADGCTRREEMKSLIASLSGEYGDAAEKITGAMQRAGLSGWGEPRK